MHIINLTRNSLLASRVGVANTFWTRLKGLCGRTSLPTGAGLLITRCQAIHMFFMKFPIDAVFVSVEDRVVGLAEDLKPYCFSPVFFKASYVVELPAGTIRRSGTQVGDQVQKESESPNSKPEIRNKSK